jgi:hypothetical protein
MLVEVDMRIINILTVGLALLAITGVLGAADGRFVQLRLDHAALVAAETDFRVRRERGSLVGTEAADYAAYIARLQRRVIEDCVALVRSGDPLPEDLPCPETLPPVTQSADIDQQAERTRSEQVAVLDAELNTGLGEYDELLLREQERIKAATPRSDEIGDGSGAGQGDGTGEDGTGEDGADVDGDREATGSDTGTADAEQPPAGSASRGAGAGGGAQQRGAGQPPDIPDGSDDDVVARQLREAAEKETDPELKKKLWEEYRKYKQGTR